MKFTMNITHRCNLKCAYCYAGSKFSKDMSPEIAEKSVDFALKTANIDDELEFSFFGGEPFLAFDFIKDLTSYIHRKARGRNAPVRLTITTNGTLLNEEMAAFLKENDIDLCISIDGPEHVHDLNRRYGNGEGSFVDVFRNLELAREALPRLQVNAVYSPETVEFMPETLSFFLSNNITVVHFNPDIKGSWTEKDVEKFENLYKEVAEIYIEAFRNGQEVAVNFLDSKMVLFLKNGYEPRDICGMGKSEMAVAPSGNIYPCERFISEDKNKAFCIGHVEQGFDAGRRCKILKDRGNKNESCVRCPLAKYCMNWCGCTNYHMTGDTGKAGGMLCANERAAIMEARHVFTTMAAEENELFIDHLMKYTNGGCNDLNLFR